MILSALPLSFHRSRFAAIETVVKINAHFLVKLSSGGLGLSNAKIARLPFAGRPLAVSTG
jgi:hypothetical protein